MYDAPASLKLIPLQQIRIGVDKRSAQCERSLGEWPCLPDCDVSGHRRRLGLRLGLRAFALNRQQVLKHHHAETACVPRRRRARPVVDNVELAFLLVDEVLLRLVQLCEQALHKHVRYRARIDAYELF